MVFSARARSLASVAEPFGEAYVHSRWPGSVGRGVLAEDVLDRIDEIGPPGTDLNPADSYYVPPSLARKALRRR
jgi:hypothetical protein